MKLLGVRELASDCVSITPTDLFMSHLTACQLMNSQVTVDEQIMS